MIATRVAGWTQVLEQGRAPAAEVADRRRAVALIGVLGMVVPSNSSLATA
jgi:hypothetical protein